MARVWTVKSHPFFGLRNLSLKDLTLEIAISTDALPNPKNEKGCLEIKTLYNSSGNLLTEFHNLQNKSALGNNRSIDTTVKLKFGHRCLRRKNFPTFWPMIFSHETYIRDSEISKTGNIKHQG